MLVQAIVIIGLVAVGYIIGEWNVRRRYRNLPSNSELRFSHFIYQKKSEDYKNLCLDARSQAESLALLANAIHQNNPSDASAKIVSALDHFIVRMNERLAAKQFTPASSELGSEQ